MQKWKQDRVYYNMTQLEKEEKYQAFLKKFFKPSDSLKYKSELFQLQLLQKKANKDLAITPLGIIFLYALARKLKPNLIVETGVHYGMSTAAFLYALHLNKKGKLISIDHCKEHPNKLGCYIPDKLKDRWTFIKGKTQEILPLLNLRGSIDIFCHDSLHSPDNQTFEYKWAWKRLKKGKILISHDIGASNAFFEFVEKHKQQYYLIKTSKHKQFGLGIIRKR